MDGPCGILLAGGAVALVSVEDFDRLDRYRWSVHSRHVRGRTIYAARKAPGNQTVLMHRDVIGTIPAGLEVDHIDGNGLDNRRSNLRLVTRSVNKQNAPKYRGKSSPFKGVTLKRFRSGNTAWTAQIIKDRQQRWLGNFATQEEAAKAYDRAALEMYGPTAYVNFRDGGTRNELPVRADEG